MRKAIYTTFAVLALLCAGALPADAHRGGGGHFSVWLGPVWPVFPAPYYYYAPPPVVVREEPEIFYEPQTEVPNYWYYCQDPRGYYPYVKHCPDGWTRVVPRPPEGKE